MIGLSVCAKMTNLVFFGNLTSVDKLKITTKSLRDCTADTKPKNWTSSKMLNF